jgi:hypothetical protein
MAVAMFAVHADIEGPWPPFCAPLFSLPIPTMLDHIPDITTDGLKELYKALLEVARPEQLDSLYRLREEAAEVLGEAVEAWPPPLQVGRK